MALRENKLLWHMIVFLRGLFILVQFVGCSNHGEQKLPSEIVWHSLMVQNTTPTSAWSTPKEWDEKKSDSRTGYDNFEGKTVLPNMMMGKDSIKKSHTIFNAYTEQSIRKNSNMIYSKSNATDGNPVNGTSGIYTAKKQGFYGFIFHALTNDPRNELPIIELRVNGITAATFNGGTYKALMFIAGAKLNQNDCVTVFVVGGPLFENVNRRSKNRASFAGTLMI